MAESLTQAEVLAMLAEQDPVERLNQKMPTDLGPMQMAVPVEEGVLDQVQRAVAERLGGGREDYRRAEKLLTAAEFLPGLGDLSDAAAASEAAGRGDLVGVGIAGLGLLPGIGGVVKRGLADKRAKLQQQESIYANRQGQLSEGIRSAPKRNQIIRERDVARQRASELRHEVDVEEREPNLPDTIITRAPDGSILPQKEFTEANEYAFHGTRGADERIIAEGGVHMNTDEPAFFMVDSPAASMTYGAGTPSDLGTVIPARIDTRGFANVDFRGAHYGDFENDGVVDVVFPTDTTFFGQKGQRFEVSANDDVITLKVDGSNPIEVPEELLGEYHPDGIRAVSDEMLINAIKDSGVPGARLEAIRDLHPSGAIMLRRSTKLKLPQEQEILTVFDKSRQRLAKGNPAIADDPAAISQAGDPLGNFRQGGEVNQMRKPVISSGLSGLLRGYTQGPLARVSRETQEPVGMFAGGMMGGFEPKIDMSNFDFSKLPAYAIPAAAAAAVEQAQERATPPPPPPPTQTTSGPPTGTSPAGPSEAEMAAAQELAAQQVAARQAEVDRANALAAQQEAEKLASEQLAAQQEAQQAAQQTAAAPTTMAATTAAAPVMPTTQELIAQQRALEQAALMGNLVSAPGQTPNEPGMFLREGTDVLLSPFVPTGGGTTGGGTTEETPVADATPDDTPVYTEPPPDSGPGPGPGNTGGGTTGGTTTGGGTTGGGTTGGGTTGGGTTGGGTTTTTGPVYLSPVDTPPVQAGPTAAEVLAAEQAAADALAAQEAEELRIAQEEADRVAAEQEAIRIANEQAAAELLAQQEAARIAQEQAAAEEAQRLAAETLAAQQAAEEAERIRLAEEEAQRIAAEQAAADAFAAQALADEQAALEALAVRQAAEEAAALAAEQEALAAAEAERIAAAKLASEQLAAQQAAQLLADQEAAAQLQAAEQLAAQQEADRLAMEAQLAATPDPDPIYDAPTQGELLQAAETAQAATGDLFTTPSQTGTAIDRSMYGQVVDPVTTTTTTADPVTTTAQQDPMQQDQTPAVITEASDGTLHPTPAAAAAYEQQLAAKQQAQQRAQESAQNFAGIQSLLRKVDLDVGDTISSYTSGYPSSQGMEIQRTYMPFEGTEEERATGYVMPVYKPVAQQSMPSLFRTRTVSDVNTDAFTAGSAAPGPDSGVINTGTQSTAPGTFGLEPTQMYRCGNGYTLQFVNGKPVCVRTGGGGPGKPPRKDPEIVDIANPGGMRYGGDVGLNRGIGSFGA